MYRTALALAGFGVEEAIDGIDALRRLDHGRPDLIVLKIELPDISGIALAEEVAAHVQTRAIPVVAITDADANLSSLRVSSILRKPVTPEQVVIAVKRGLAGAVSC